MTRPAASELVLEPFSYAEARAIADELGLAEPVAVTLVRRGYRSVAAARELLEAEIEHDPNELEGMAEAVALVRGAIAAGRRVTVHGDYDVDGVCSTAILVGALRALGGDCDWLIPDRLADGYGLTAASVAALAARGTGLLITTDCGIGSLAEVEAARAAGIEVLVTDHHQPGERLPACPVLHPVVCGYPCPDLCGTGVAWKLAAALRGAEAVVGDLDLVALATVADMVPLRGENRTLVRRGLAEARRARRPGLRALLAAARVAPERLDEGDLAFRLAPRINAAGRLYRADAGVELMLTGDDARATEIAAELDRANAERRTVEDEALAGAERARAALPAELRDAPGLVLAGEGWHPGVVGIVASRLAERHWRPVVLIALDGEGGGRGSGRSVPGFDLLAALSECAEHLERFGGHRAAAGLEIEAAKVGAFREAFARAAEARLGAQGAPRVRRVDAVVGGESLGHDVAEQLGRLGPFGQGNPAVNLLVAAARVSDVRPIGESGRHARFSVASGRRRALGVAFGVNGELEAAAAAPWVDLSVRLELNEWNGAVEPRVVLGEVHLGDEPGGEGEAEPPGDEEFWRRFDAELGADPRAWPAARAEPPAGRRRVVERPDCSPVAAVAALASSGEPVLALAADAQRRRGVVARAARPARLGGGEVAVLAAGLAEEPSAAAAERLAAAGSGVVLADWTALARRPGLAERFPHLVVIDPAPHPSLDRLCRGGEGYLHLAAGPAETEFALQVLADELPGAESLRALYRELRAAPGAADGLAAGAARAALCGPRRQHPRTPEVAARHARVLGELGLVRWQRPGARRALGVVSSLSADLEGSEAYVAYRERYEEGRRYLTGHRQTQTQGQTQGEPTS